MSVAFPVLTDLLIQEMNAAAKTGHRAMLMLREGPVTRKLSRAASRCYASPMMLPIVVRNPQGSVVDPFGHIWRVGRILEERFDETPRWFSEVKEAPYD